MNLIVYYSRTGENYFNGELKKLSKGNTETVAEYIKETVGGDMLHIRQAVPYSDSYNECIAEALKDQKAKARPEITGLPNSIEKYDTVYLGFPNYWGTMPMAVFSFLESFNFDGKVIVPFCTHEGSGMGSSVSDVKKACPKAVVKNGFSVFGHNVTRAGEEVKKLLATK